MVMSTIIIFTILCTVFYVFIAPFKLSKRKIKIKPNIFESFVENDEGYVWSRSSERKKSYKNKLEKQATKSNL